MLRCGIVILAAGNSSRLGFAKQLVHVDGSTLLARMVNHATGLAWRPVVVVLGSQAQQMRTQIEHLPVTIAVNDHWATGIGSSIRCGVRAAIDIEPHLHAIAIVLCDQYRITAEILDRLVTTHFASGRCITAASYGQTLGTPTVFGNALFAELIALPPNRGGKVVIERHMDEVESMPLPEAETDLDTKDDYESLIKKSSYDQDPI